MSLKKYSEDYLLSLLNEAPDDGSGMGQTATMTNSDNAAYEPQEQDATMDLDSGMGDGTSDPGMEEMDMGDGSMDAGMGGSMDAGMGGEPAVNTKDLFKKRKLFQDYKDLLSSMESIMEVSALLTTKDLTEDSKKIYRFLNHKMEENLEKVRIILTEQFFNLSYQQLLTIYLYIKMATKLYADMIKQINVLYRDEN